MQPPLCENGRRSRKSEMRERILEESVIAKGMVVLNEPIEYCTFSGVRGQNDIDVTLIDGGVPF